MDWPVLKKKNIGSPEPVRTQGGIFPKASSPGVATRLITVPMAGLDGMRGSENLQGDVPERSFSSGGESGMVRRGFTPRVGRQPGSGVEILVSVQGVANP